MHCPACGFDSNNYECILDLSLEVGGGITSVERALRAFTAKETLDEDALAALTVGLQPVLPAASPGAAPGQVAPRQAA